MVAAVLWEEKPRESGRRVFEYTQSGLSLKAIPEKAECPMCGTECTRKLIGHTLRSPLGGPKVRALEVPGYLCSSCECDFFEPDASLPLLKMAARICGEVGETAAHEFFEKEVAREESRVA